MYFFLKIPEIIETNGVSSFYAGKHHKRSGARRDFIISQFILLLIANEMNICFVGLLLRILSQIALASTNNKQTFLWSKCALISSNEYHTKTSLFHQTIFHCFLVWRVKCDFSAAIDSYRKPSLQLQRYRSCITARRVIAPSQNNTLLSHGWRNQGSRVRRWESSNFGMKPIYFCERAAQ